MAFDARVVAAMASGALQAKCVLCCLVMCGREQQISQAILVEVSELERDVTHLHRAVGPNPDQFVTIAGYFHPVSYTHLRAHETPEHLVCRLLLEKKKKPP